MRFSVLALASAVAMSVGPQDRLSPEPVTLVTIVDVSVSMVHVPPPADLLDAAEASIHRVIEAVIDGLHDGDHVLFGRVARSVEFGEAFVSPSEARRASRVVEAGPEDRHGPSPLWDAIDGALAHLDGVPGKKAILVWSDGRASGNRLGMMEVARRAVSLRVPIYAVSPPTERQVRQTETTAVIVRPGAYLQRLVEISGGAFLLQDQGLASPGDPWRAIKDAIDALRVR